MPDKVVSIANIVDVEFLSFLEAVDYRGKIRQLEDGRLMIAVITIACMYNIQYVKDQLLVVTRIGHEDTPASLAEIVGEGEVIFNSENASDFVLAALAIVSSEADLANVYFNSLDPARN